MDNSVVQSDIVVVGAGMVGLTAALALAAEGLNIAVLEARAVEPSTALDQVAALDGYDNRVSALTCASQQILQTVGAWDAMKKLRIAPYTGMDVWDGQGTGHIHFSSRDLHEESLGHIVENRVTVAALLSQLDRFENVQLFDDIAIRDLSAVNANGKRSIVLVDGRRFETQLVVACDGANSKARQMAGIPMWEWDYGHHAIVATVDVSLPHQATAWQCFTDDGPLAFLPLPDVKKCSIVWSTSPAHAKSLMELSDEAFCAQLQTAFESKLGNVTGIDRRQVHPLRQRHAKYYAKPGFVVLGDAAHTIHPLAGQGVNLGLLDAASLAEVVAVSAQRGEPFGSEAVLMRFQRECQSRNVQMSAAMEGFKRLFASQQPIVQLARNMGMSLLNKAGPVKNHIVYQAMGLSGKLPDMAKRPVTS